MTIKYTNILHSKVLQIGIFGFKNILSGNPVQKAARKIEKRARESKFPAKISRGISFESTSG
jgi:hypothetical protein